jgi:hypothetical protein
LDFAHILKAIEEQRRARRRAGGFVDDDAGVALAEAPAEPDDATPLESADALADDDTEASPLDALDDLGSLDDDASEADDDLIASLRQDADTPDEGEPADPPMDADLAAMMAEADDSAAPEDDRAMSLPGVEPDPMDDVLDETVAAEDAAVPLEADASLDAEMPADAEGDDLEAMIAELKADSDDPTAALDDELSSLDPADGESGGTVVEKELGDGEPLDDEAVEVEMDLDLDENAADAEGEEAAAASASSASELEALLSDDESELGLDDVDVEADAGMADMEDLPEEPETDEEEAAAAVEESAETDPGEVEADGDQPDLSDLLGEVGDMIETGEPEPEAAEDAPQEEAAAETPMNVEEAARILDIDDTEQALAVGDGEVEDEELMRQVQQEAQRLSENLDDIEGDPEGADDASAEAGLEGVEAGAGAAVATHPGGRRIPVLRVAFAKLLDILNYPFDVLRLDEQTRNTVGYTALLVTMVMAVIVTVVLVFSKLAPFM